MEYIKNKLKSLNHTQIKKIYCKMMKLKKTSLKKNKMISKLLAPLQTKYRMKSSGGIEIPPEIFQRNLVPYLDDKSYGRYSTTQSKYQRVPWPIREANDPLLGDPSSLGTSMYAGGIKRKNKYLKRKNEYLELEKKYSDPGFIEDFDDVEDFVEYLLDKRPKNVQDIYKIIEYKDEWVQKDINEIEIKNEIKTYEIEYLMEEIGIKYLIEEIGIETNYLLYETVLDTIEERDTDEDIIKIIKYLLEKGADINYVHKKDDDTLLLISILNDRFDLVKYLVEKGAIVTQTEIDVMEYKIAENAGTELTEREKEIQSYLREKFDEQ
jgi:hypothetical protein